MSRPDEIAKPKIFHFAGLDLLLDKEGKWVLLEVNDHPIGLIEADILTRSTGSDAIFGEDAIGVLAEKLAIAAGDKAVCLLLPECFRVQTKTHFAEQVYKYSKKVYDDIRLTWTLRKFNTVAKRIQQLGVPCFISDVLGVKLHGDQLLLSNGAPVGVLFRRAAKFPPIEIESPCVNDLRLRSLCTDKLKSYDVLREKLDSGRLPFTFPLLPNKDAFDALALYASHEEMVVTKPNWGAASRGVKRISPDQALEDLRSNGKAVDASRICQKWIEPSSVRNARGEYYFDVRIYVVGGDVVAGFARRSAAPKGGQVKDSPLSWLTTTGPLLPLVRASRTKLENVVGLTEAQIQELREICTKATMALDEAGSKLGYAEAYEQIPGFAALAGINDKLRFIILKDR